MRSGAWSFLGRSGAERSVERGKKRGAWSVQKKSGAERGAFEKREERSVERLAQTKLLLPSLARLKQ